jgi:hypothetical protein
MKDRGASYLGRIIISWCALEAQQIRDAKERRFTSKPRNGILKGDPSGFRWV